MTDPVAPTRTCRFPGCQRPPAPAEEGVGRPPEYCDDPAHNRGAAWRARRAAAAVTAERAVPDDLDRPVSMARARAGEYAERVAAQVHTLTATLATVVTELRTLGDPDAAAAQIDAVTADAEQRVAEATARAARAATPKPASPTNAPATKTGSPNSAPKSTNSGHRNPGATPPEEPRRIDPRVREPPRSTVV